MILEDCSDPERWTGKIDNDARQINTARVLLAGKLVTFHPLEIISIW